MKPLLISDLLPPEALRELEKLARSGHCDIKTIQTVTDRYREELLAKGVDDNYLAYALQHMLLATYG